MGILCNCLVDTLTSTHYVISSPLNGVKLLHSTQYDLTRSSIQIPPKHKNAKKNDTFGCLAHVMRDARSTASLPTDTNPRVGGGSFRTGVCVLTEGAGEGMGAR